MAYIKSPPKDKWIDRGLLSAAYLVLGLGSLALWLLTPPSQGSVVPVWLIDTAGIISAVSSVAVIVGVVRFNLLIESTALWPTMTGIIVYIITNFTLLTQATTTARVAMLLFFIALVIFLIWRLWRLRRQIHIEGASA